MSTKLERTVCDHALWASNWLLVSGIQDMSGDRRYQGGVNAWFDLNAGCYPFIYAEITGYAVTAHLFFFHMTQNESFRSAALQAADWLLVNRSDDTGLIPTRLNHRGFEEEYFTSCYFVFDQWMIVNGLCNMYEECGVRSYLDAACEIAEFLLKHTIRQDGTFDPIYDARAKKSLAKFDQWSREPGAYHLKALMALDKLYKLTQTESFRLCTNRLVRAYVPSQDVTGRFITHQQARSTHLHPHFYALEGLLYEIVVNKRHDLTPVVRRGLSWVMKEQNEDGGFYSFYGGRRFLPRERADVLAQALRVGVILCHIDSLVQPMRNQLDKLRSRLISYQIRSGSQRGGFFYGQDLDGAVRRHVNAWVAMFAAQGLWLYDQLVMDRNDYDFRFFV